LQEESESMSWPDRTGDFMLTKTWE